MKHLLKFTFALLATVAFTLGFTGCNDGGSDNGALRPDSLTGTTIEFNPTIEFTTATTLVYDNRPGSSNFDSEFPTANNQAGTYTYVASNTTGTGKLTITLPGPEDIELDLSNFSSNRKNFRASYQGKIYPVTVTSGTLVLKAAGGGGGGGNLGANETRADDIPSGWRGTQVLTFQRNPDVTPVAGVPADGTEVTFTIAARTLSFNGKTLRDPIFYNGGQEYIFKDGNLWYCLSGSDTTLNEINLQSPYTGNFNTKNYGQFNDKDNPASGGSYNSIGFGSNGGYVGGGFTANVTGVTEPVTDPEGTDLAVQNLTNGQTVSFTFSNNGDLVSPDLAGAFVFNGSNETTVTYKQTRLGDTPGVDDTIVIQKAAQGGLPVSLTFESKRIQTTPSIKTTTVTYTLDVNIP